MLSRFSLAQTLARPSVTVPYAGVGAGVGVAPGPDGQSAHVPRAATTIMVVAVAIHGVFEVTFLTSLVVIPWTSGRGSLGVSVDLGVLYPQLGQVTKLMPDFVSHP